MSVTILNGDCREVLRSLPSESVHCVVTSPPYWGLRDYGAPEQIGLEHDFKDYIETLVEAFRQVRRVLRGDGTCWLNLGDSYANDGKWGGETGGKQSYLDDNDRKRVGREKRVTGLKPKDLIGIPWRVAFALQADGWWLRQDIIWAKPNPMPESVADRCTKSHEYLFLLSKSERYFYDAEAIREDGPSYVRKPGHCSDDNSAYVHSRQTNMSIRTIETSGRNKRSVWEVATAPFSEAHFATFPPALIEPCIKAGCPHGGTVLDPFFGAGTTGLVADRLGRDCIGIELNPEYAAIAEHRIKSDSPLFTSGVQRRAYYSP